MGKFWLLHEYQVFLTLNREDNNSYFLKHKLHGYGVYVSTLALCANIPSMSGFLLENITNRGGGRGDKLCPPTKEKPCM